MNLSINHGIVPDEMKISSVIPLFILATTVHLQIIYQFLFFRVFQNFLNELFTTVYNYIDKNRILCDSQYGFRKQHSTSLALINIYDKISTSIDSREYAVGIFLDLSKAFDRVNHTILLDKLEYYGIRGLSLNWFKSYLSKTVQFVEFNMLK